VQPNLLRIAVGLEPFEELRDKFEAAFRASRL
jgi:cystathionine beta-lyase/cystathionine gamma-synthase